MRLHGSGYLLVHSVEPEAFEQLHSLLLEKPILILSFRVGDDGCTGLLVLPEAVREDDTCLHADYSNFSRSSDDAFSSFEVASLMVSLRCISMSIVERVRERGY